MSRPNYDVKQTYTGTGSLDEYTFDFKIEALAQLLVIVCDDDGIETERVRGDDTTYLDSVEFDAVDGAGTVFLNANLPASYSLIILLANDEPTQPYEFSNNQSFSLRTFEAAYDWLTGCIQRLAYLAKQSIRIHDLDDETEIDLKLPPGFADNADKPIVVNDDGDGLTYGTAISELEANIQAAQDTADGAQADVDALQAEFDAYLALTTRYIVGSVNVDGSWRHRQDGVYLHLENRVSGTWKNVETYGPP